MKEIKRIIFYSNKGEIPYKEEAYIEYMNGTSEFLSKDDGISKSSLLVKKHKKSFDELVKEDIISFMHINKLKEFIDKETMLEDNVNRVKVNKPVIRSKLSKKYKNMSDKLENEYLNIEENEDESVKRTIKKTLLILLLSFGIGTALGRFAPEIITNKTAIRQEDNDDKDKEKILSLEIFSLITNKNINENRRNFIRKNWEYLIDYNSTSAHSLAEMGNSTRISHTFEEIMLSQLILNNYSDKELQEIFGSYNINVDKLINSYKEGVNQDILAHIVQTKSLKKQSLTTDNNTDKFYTKYETLMIDFNNADEENKLNVAKKFYKMIREDFEFTDEKIDTYKMSVIPIIKAMDRVCSKLNTNFILNDKEKKYFDKILINNTLKPLIDRINTITENYSIDEEITFKDMMNIEINDAIMDGIYKNGDKERDISNHQDYLENINVFNDSKDDYSNVKVKKKI